MRPLEFKEQNVVFAKDQPQYQPLPALRVPDDDQGRVITCWKLSEAEFQQIAKTRVVWLQQLTFNANLQPLYLTTNVKELNDGKRIQITEEDS